jgi:hypothetical protein
MSLNDVLSRDVLARVLEMPDIGERLRPGLPENWEQQGHNVSDAVQSPQFQQVSLPVPVCARLTVEGIVIVVVGA